MDLAVIFERLGIALLLGLLVGLQRERVASPLAGFRTFPLIAVLGSLCGLLSQSLGGWLIAAGLLALAGVIIVGNLAEMKTGRGDPGLTTEMAMLVMFGVGAYLIVGQREVAVAIGGGTAVLLHWKARLHTLAARLGENDLRAIMQFALISLVILPVLPNRTFGPYDVLNLQQLWLMVVLIVGISLGGYIAYKFLGQEAGIVLGGLLGGTISSTATTVSYARRSAEAPGGSSAAALVITLASAVVFVRLLLEIAVVAPSFLRAAAPPLLIMMILFTALALALWLRTRKTDDALPEQDNPSELKAALLFGALFALVLLAAAAARDVFGDRGLYWVAGLSGLTDMDAITLSTAQLVNAGRIAEDTAWRLILLASLSNLVFKGAVVAVLGHRSLLVRIAVLYGAALALGVLMLFYWGAWSL